MKPSAKLTPRASNRPKTTNRNAKGRPFAAEIMNQAEALADTYQVILDNDAGHWYGRGLELPHVMADGPTPEKCIAATRAALTAAVAYLLEQGKQPPPSARAGRRTQQVNVRLTIEEKTLLASVARSKGYQGLGDYLRSAALETA